MDSEYFHTQRGYTVLVAAGLGLLIPLVMTLGSLGRGESPAPVALMAALFVAVLLLGWVFSSLTIRVGGGRLTWSFGLGLFRRSVPLAEIEEVSAAGTTWLDGWGIHLTPRGWIYNVAGREAVEIRMASGRRFRLGTDEAERLIAAIRRARG